MGRNHLYIAVLKKVRYALCPMPYALCPALCPMPMSTSYESSKGYIDSNQLYMPTLSIFLFGLYPNTEPGTVTVWDLRQLS